MRKHLALLISLSLLAAPQSLAGAKPSDSGKASGKDGQAKTGEKLDWLAFDAATDQAQKQGKHVIVDIYTTWCGWCKIMDRDTYGNAEVAAYLRENFILAKVNGESSAKLRWKGKELTERQFARTVGVSGYPATYFLKPNAELLGGVGGYLRSPEFLIYARYVSTRWYEKGKIQAYIDSLRSASSVTQ